MPYLRIFLGELKIQQIEELVPPADHHNATGQIIPQNQGMHGPVNISLAPAVPFPTEEHVIASCVCSVAVRYFIPRPPRL